MLENNACLSNAIYIVEAPNLDAFKHQIKNVAPGTDLSDAINLEQLNNSISSIPLNDYLPLSGGNLTGDLSAANADVYIMSGNYI